MVMYLAVVMVLGSTIFLVSGQSTPTAGCNFEQDVVPGQTYFVYSPNYPGKYPADRYCRYFARAPSTYQMNITCTVRMPYDVTCAAPKDRLLVSLTGQTTNFHTYCGTGTFSLQTEGNNLLIELHVPQVTERGSFECSLIAITKPTPPTACECGWKKQSRIVNGQETGINEYPMMVGIIDTDIRELICGGTIISNRYILTAAHCLVNKLPAKIGNLIGDHDISIGTETNSAQLLMSQRFIGHPNYDTVTQVNDIALIQVVGFITYSLEVGPACLPFRNPNKPSVGEVITVLGWGTIEHAGAKSDVLQKTELDVVSISKCQQEFKTSNITDNQICTFRQGTDACQADSGGPVIFEGDRVWLEGIISYGKSCALQYPGVNTRVGRYLQWILQSTSGESYCVR